MPKTKSPKQKRFPSWRPQVGEKALVPGGPANAQYVAELNAQDVDAIEQGHRGYTPLRVRLYWKDRGHTECFDLVQYDTHYKCWRSVRGGHAKTLSAVIRAANQYLAIQKVTIDVAE